jgi:SAM-dependent methyltransferase
MKMVKPSLPTCPVCQAGENEPICSLDCGNLDKSTLYPTARIDYCLNCGHIFNELTAEELAGLANYYNDEYAPANLTAVDTTGDRPGSSGRLTLSRYDQLFRALSPHMDFRHSILDVGCASGGFLDYLNHKGFTHLAGVDLAEIYVERARLGNRYKIEIGNAESLPFDDHTFDIIVAEQVLEHLFNPIKVFQEARRVLKNDGIFCLGVPDAARYLYFPFFDFYWLLLREHIQHFDITHLAFLGGQTGFRLLQSHETVHAIMTERMIMPNLYAVFRLTDSPPKGREADPNNFNLIRLFNDYIIQEDARQSVKREKLSKLIQSQQPVYVWGIGREFLYLYESAGLKYCCLTGLIDSNPFKQASGTLKGMKILNGEALLPEAVIDSVLLITAVAHTDVIRHKANALGFSGMVIDFREQNSDEWIS